jgi:hypothetical protein
VHRAVRGSMRRTVRRASPRRRRDRRVRNDCRRGSRRNDRRGRRVRHDLRWRGESRVPLDDDRLETRVDHAARYRHEPISGDRVAGQRYHELVLPPIGVAIPERWRDADRVAIDDDTGPRRRRTQRDIDRSALARPYRLRWNWTGRVGIDLYARRIDTGSHDDRCARHSAVTRDQRDRGLGLLWRRVVVSRARHRREHENDAKR